MYPDYDFIKDLPILSNQESAELARKRDSAKPGSREYTAAINKIVLGNYRYVVKVAFNMANIYCPRRPLLHDLTSEGIIGAFTAAERWNPEMSRYSTYAPYWIKNGVIRSINNYQAIARAATYRTNLPFAMKIFGRHVCGDNGNGKGKVYPEYDELPALKKQILNGVIGISRPVLSINKSSDNGEQEHTLNDIIRDKNAGNPLNNHLDKESMLTVMRLFLKPREMLALKLHYGIGNNGDRGRALNLRQAGKIMGCSYEDVRLIENRAISKLMRGAPRRLLEEMLYEK